MEYERPEIEVIELQLGDCELGNLCSDPSIGDGSDSSIFDTDDPMSIFK